MGQANSYSRSDGNPNFNFEGDGSFGVPQNKRRFRHPAAVFFHVVFKLSTIVIYLFGNLFGQEFLGMFVALVFLISIDFWVVKNITGRLLVGLRWWNYIDDEGQSHWVFENRAANAAAASANGGGGNSSADPSDNDMDFVLFSQENDDRVKAMAGRDATVFWVTLFIAPVLWFFFLISAIFSFNIHWVLFVGMALVLSGSNLYGYMRCRFGVNHSYTSMITQYVGPKMLFNLMKSSADQAAQQQQKQTQQPHQQVPSNL